MKSKSSDILISMCNIITLMFGVRRDSLEKTDIFKIYASNIQIQLYIQEIINNKFIKIAEMNGEIVEQKGSAFDEFDEENGYINKEEEKNVYERYKETLNYILRYSINALNNSYKESIECNLAEMLDYIIFNLEYEKENKEDIEN